MSHGLRCNLHGNTFHVSGVISMATHFMFHGANSMAAHFHRAYYNTWNCLEYCAKYIKFLAGNWWSCSNSRQVCPMSADNTSSVFKVHTKLFLGSKNQQQIRWEDVSWYKGEAGVITVCICCCICASPKPITRPVATTSCGFLDRADKIRINLTQITFQLHLYLLQLQTWGHQR